MELLGSDKVEVAEKLCDKLRNENPSFLLRMAEAYFLGPGFVDYSTSKPASYWTWLGGCIIAVWMYWFFLNAIGRVLSC